MLIARIMKKPVVFCIPGNDSLAAKISNSILYKPIEFLFLLCCTISNFIILYSPNLIREWDLNQYLPKIIIAHRHFLDYKKFSVLKRIRVRPQMIGYIGRFSAEKGILNFITTIPLLLHHRPNLNVFIGGDGPLKKDIETILEKKEISDNVTFSGWIDHEDLPQFLNDLRLLILPSFTFEGLPNIILEAMACGTPVLATPIGAIPDIIQDGKTGFLMENNSPECIEKNVLRALDSPDLEMISENGRRFVEVNHDFKEVLKKWKGVLSNIESLSYLD